MQERVHPDRSAELGSEATESPGTSTTAPRRRTGEPAGDRAASADADPLSDMGRLFDADFDDVRIRRASAAATSIEADAFTRGDEIHFAPGQYRPDTATGRQLLGHELAHVVQQRAGRVRPSTMLASGTTVNTDPALEREADVAGSRVARGLPAGMSSTTVHRRAAAPVTQGRFAVGVRLGRAGDDGPDTPASSLRVGRVALAAGDRPPTQFAGRQASHTVSWTLLVQSYEAAAGMPLTDFVRNRLIPDVRALAAQNDERPSPVVHGFLGNWGVPRLTALLDERHSDLDWHQLVGSAVREYFVALQSAPFSTHTALEHLDAGYFADRPAPHGEGQANDFFQSAEALPGDQLAALDHGTVVNAALAYLDTGAWQQHGGITSVRSLALILHHWETALRRAFPRTWERWGAAVEAYSDAYRIDAGIAPGFGDVMHDHVALARAGRADEIGVGVGASDLTDDLPYTTFVAQVDLVPAVGSAARDELAADAFDVVQIDLPDDRMPTKYLVRQKSHTVAWSLVRRSLEGLAGQTLPELLAALVEKWRLLDAQDWASMTDPGTQLITARDLGPSASRETVDRRNQENRVRLQALHANIHPNIASLTAAQGQQHSDLAWTNLVQGSLSAYVETMQSAPLTAMQAEPSPKGHGEADADEYLSRFEDDAMSDLELLRKTRAEIWKQVKSLSGTKVLPTLHWSDPLRASVDPAFGDPHVDESLRARMRSFLVGRLAVKYLDLSWTNIGSPQHMAVLLYEWESALRAAYPNLWTTDADAIRGHSDAFKISHTNQHYQFSVGLFPPIERTETTMAQEMAEIRAAPTAYLARTYTVLDAPSLKRQGDDLDDEHDSKLAKGEQQVVAHPALLLVPGDAAAVLAAGAGAIGQAFQGLDGKQYQLYLIGPEGYTFHPLLGH